MPPCPRLLTAATICLGGFSSPACQTDDAFMSALPPGKADSLSGWRPNAGELLVNGSFGAPLDRGWDSSIGFVRDQGGVVGTADAELVARLDLPDYALSSAARIELSARSLDGESADVEISLTDCSNGCASSGPWIAEAIGTTKRFFVELDSIPDGSELAIRVRSGTALVDNVHVMVEGTTGLLGACQHAPLSALGGEIATTLEQYRKTRASGAIVSTLGQCGDIPPEFLVIELDDFEDRLMELMAGTQRHLRIATYTIEREGMAKLANGLRRLHDQFPNDQEPYPLVEILYSHAPVSSPSPDKLVDIVGDAMDGIPESDWHFFLVLRQYGFFGSLNYNHSKIAVRDGEEALVGGHNLVRFVDQPVDDLSMTISGDAALLAEQHFDAMWRRAQLLAEPRFGPEEIAYGCGASDNFGPDYACATASGRRYYRDIAFTDRVPPPHVQPRRWSPLNVFGLGRGRIAPAGQFETQDDFSGDRAIIAALDHAKDSIKLVQHGLANHVLPLENHLNREVERALLDAVLFRDVEVELINSDRWPSTPFNSDAQRSVDLIYKAAWPHARERLGNTYPDQASVFDQLDCKLRVFRYRNPETGTPLTHAKFFIIDNGGYYVGAQNLYPNVDILDDLDREKGRALVNFGYYIDDLDQTGRILDTYWSPLLRQSRSERVLPEGRPAHCRDDSPADSYR